MEEKDRVVIVENLEILAQCIDLETWIVHAVACEVFTEQMIEGYWNSNEDVCELKKQMLRDACKRGSKSMERLVKSLLDAKQYKAAKILRPELNIPDELLYQKNEHISKVVVRRGSVPQPEYQNSYYLTSNPRGYALIIVNDVFKNPEKHATRHGAKEDVRLWTDLFSQLGYDTRCARNVTTEGMNNVLTEFSKFPGHAKVQSSIVAIASHGGKNTIICADSEPYSTAEIFKKFDNSNCPLLKHRPKMFFLQACRGALADIGTQNNVSRFGLEQSEAEFPFNYSHIPVITDMIIAYSSVDDYVSYRNRYYGSWFIEIMTLVFMENAWHMDLEEMLKLVQKEMCRKRATGGEMQMCEIVHRGWFNRLYFNP